MRLAIKHARSVVLRLRVVGPETAMSIPDQGRRVQLQLIQFFDHFLHSADHERKPIVIELIGRVVSGMIVRIAKRRGVSDHDAGITVSPE